MIYFDEHELDEYVEYLNLIRYKVKKRFPGEFIPLTSIDFKYIEEKGNKWKFIYKIGSGIDAKKGNITYISFEQWKIEKIIKIREEKLRQLLG